VLRGHHRFVVMRHAIASSSPLPPIESDIEIFRYPSIHMLKNNLTLQTSARQRIARLPFGKAANPPQQKANDGIGAKTGGVPIGLCRCNLSGSLPAKRSTSRFICFSALLPDHHT
jgi:hypothetical protein